MKTSKTLTKRGQIAKKAFKKQLKIRKSKTKKPIVVAMIGLVGSGKSSVAEELARGIGTTVISSDQIRIELRKQKESYEQVQTISLEVALEILKQGSNLIIDSDFIDSKKRQALREKVHKAGAHLFFVRVYCEPDVAFGRIVSAKYRDLATDFFGGASSAWNGNAQSRGVVVKVRELWRRTPLHYRWVNQGGGKWVLKKLPFAILAEINTSGLWKRELRKCTKKLLTG